MEINREKRGDNKKLKRITYNLLTIPLLFIVFLFPKHSFAYTDYSIYRLESGPFVGEQAASTALQKLKQDTGWWATYAPTGDSMPYYQIFSGGFYGEDNVKGILSQFQNNTGINANYEPVGNKEAYQSVISGGFYGESNISSILKQFKDSTGFSAHYEPTGEASYKKKIMTGGFVGEDNVKSILKQFQDATGISATYEPTGQSQANYQLVTGGFAGEDNVKSIIQDLTNQTGLKATYEPVQYDQAYSILTGGFYGVDTVKALVDRVHNDLGVTVNYESTNLPNIYKIRFAPMFGDSLSKVTNYLDRNGWWYAKLPTDTKVPTVFRIVSEQTLDKGKIDAGYRYFKNHGWWVVAGPTNQTSSNIFRIVSTSLTDDATVKQGVDYFKNKGWFVFDYTTNEKYYSIFRIVTDPLLGTDKVNKALNFFKDHGWWVMSNPTNNYGYTTFRIVSQPVLGQDKNNLGVKFFKDRGWWVASYPTGQQEGVYKIVTGGFQGYDTALANIQRLKDGYGWSATAVRLGSSTQVMYTNYNLSLPDMLNLEMTLSPQTEKYKDEPAYVYSAYIDPVKNMITGDTVNVRSGPFISPSNIVSKLNYGYKGFTNLGKVGNGDWTQISLRWRNAKPDDVQKYLDPNNFPSNSQQYYQFLKLSSPAGINVDEVNTKILNNAGILKNMAYAFVQAGKQNKVNEIYLISHALLETGNGSSQLANGVMYNGQKVYNMYGYGAIDSCPVDCGAKKAYEMGWTSPEKAIIGGAALIGSGYINNNSTFQQDTIYKMRWNPVNPYHQYATDIQWASAQVPSIYNLYKLLDNYTLYFDVPVYNK